MPSQQSHDPQPGSARLIEFYRGTGPDASGRRIDEILARDDGWLEHTHDYIQWLFPTGRPSRFNPEAPVLDRAAVEAFRSDAGLREKLRRALSRMLEFYGLRWSPPAPGREGPAVQRGASWELRRDNWLTPGNHNHLRITRILSSTRTLGLEPESAALFDALSEVYRSEDGRAIERRTYDFWKRAAGGEEV